MKQAQGSLLDALVARATDLCSARDDVNALWLGGSLGRGEGDYLSDIDLVVVAGPDRAPGLVRALPDLARSVTAAVLLHEARRNAPVEGAQLNVLYDVEPLPVYIDWNVWPQADEAPSDVRVLFDRSMRPVSSRETFASMLEPMAKGTDPPLEERLARFRIFMVPILVKHAVRGWLESVERMLAIMQCPGPVASSAQAVAMARSILDENSTDESAEAVACIRRYIDQLSG